MSLSVGLLMSYIWRLQTEALDAFAPSLSRSSPGQQLRLARVELSMCLTRLVGVVRFRLIRTQLTFRLA